MGDRCQTCPRPGARSRLRMLRLALALPLLASLRFLRSTAPAVAAPQKTVNLAGEWKYLPYDGEGNMAGRERRRRGLARDGLCCRRAGT